MQGDGLPDRVNIYRGQALIGEQTSRQVRTVDLEALVAVACFTEPHVVQDAGREQQLLVVVAPGRCTEVVAWGATGLPALLRVLRTR